MTGSIFLVAKSSPAIKTLVRPYDQAPVSYTETLGISDDDDLIYSASAAIASGSTNVKNLISAYMDKVKDQDGDPRAGIVFKPVSYFSKGTTGVPGYTDTAVVEVAREINAEDTYQWQNYQRKVIRNCLVPDALVENPRSTFGYTNYHCLNIMSTSFSSVGQALIYPNYKTATRPYTPSSAFTINFFVKPKKMLDTQKPHVAGTVMHLSSSFAVTIVSGSRTADDGKPETFRVLFQIGSGSAYSPKDLNPLSFLPGVTPPSYPQNLIFSTDDVLKRDVWHQVSIRWDANRSYGTGSIIVDNSYRRTFTFPSGTVDPYGSASTPGGLVIGNFYDSGDSISKFFNSNNNSIDGTVVDPNASSTDPTGFTFGCQLNAEIHQLSIFKRYLSDEEIGDLASATAITSSSGPAFYLPVHFSGSTSKYKTYGSPKELKTVSTDSPFSYDMAAGYNGYYLNLQNFIADAVTANLPRAYGYHSPVQYGPTYDLKTQDTNDVLMTLNSVKRRNFLVVPCDNGTYTPTFNRIQNDNSRFTKNDAATISMTQLVPNDVLKITPTFADTSIPYDGVFTSTLQILPVLQNSNANFRSGYEDLSSNLVTVISIPTPYYGNRIVPNTVVLTDSSVSGSSGQKFTLRDDGIGNLYRHDTASAPAMWNRVGSIFYDHGIVALMSPHIPFFAKEGYTISFRGEHRKHVMSVAIPAKPDALNTSRNTSYKRFPPSDLLSEQAEDFVYITGINLHDQNFNVVMRAKLAQAVHKRESDEIVFRLRYDF
jgi:hypothetical protein